MSTLADEVLTGLMSDLAASYEPPGHGPSQILASATARPQARPGLRQRRGWLGGAVALVLLGLLVTVVARPGGRAAEHSAAVGGVATGSFSSGGTAGAAVPANPPTKALAAVPAPPGDAAARQPQAASGLAPAVGAPPVDGAASRVVKSGTISLVVKDKAVPSTLTAIDRMATAEGGYVAESADSSGASPSGQVTIRVPVARFERLLADIRGLDAKVLTASTTGRDVSGQYTDLESQLGSLRAARERFLSILGQAKTIGEILTVQQRVDDVTGQIDTIEGQRRLLASQSDLSTLTVSVSQAGDPVLTASSPPRSGLSQAFSDAWTGFVSGVEAIIARSGRALVVLLCLGIMLVLARAGWRLARRRTI